MSDLTKALIGQEDISQVTDELYPTGTFTRLNYLGGLNTMTKLPNLALTHFPIINARYYGGSAGAMTKATIDSALAALGTSTNYILVLERGTWTLNANTDWSAYTNITFKLIGAVISHGDFTLNIPNLDIGPIYYAWHTGNGAVTYSGGDTRTVWIPAGFMTPATTNGCAALATTESTTYQRNRDYLAFDGTTEEYASFEFVYPENWSRGTIKARFDWSSATGSTAGDTVEWEIAARTFSDGDILDAPLGTPQVISDTLLADNGANRQLTAATPAITIAPSVVEGLDGVAYVGNSIHHRISRNVGGTDNMTEDAWLFGVWIQFREIVPAAAW